MKELVAGIVAHVDAGKTTLSEALLYRTGTVRKLGRVDNGDAFLDSDALEKKRGITIFSHQARLTYGDLALTLLDTPGHVDFASQTEQVLSVLDYAILVVSATDGIQGYTRTLWQLLAHYGVPTVVFVNKMDVAQADSAQVLAMLQRELDAAITDFTAPDAAATQEAIAVCDDAVLEDYLDTGTLADATVQDLIARRRVFPCYFGAALRLDGVPELLSGLSRFGRQPALEAEFGARVFKISRDDKGERLTWVRLTGGELLPKTPIGEQKINQLRVYNGQRYEAVPRVAAGTVCAIPGLADTAPGQAWGAATPAPTPLIQPVLTYAVRPGQDELPAVLAALRQLEEEDPLLAVTWSSRLQEIRVQVMGQVQLEVLTQLLAQRFGLTVTFGEGSILYRETLTAPVEGVGHFEPLRHYSEVHLLMAPAPRGTGITFASDCALEVLPRNWQHQVEANLRAKTQLGVLIGAPLTDVTVTLVGGGFSIKHTVGGDFREATWRAVRQGLMMARRSGDCQLLEPWYRFRLQVAETQLGRAMSDVQQMGGSFDAPQQQGAQTILTGTAPVAGMQDYPAAVRAYTHGQGVLECVVDGYRPCHNADAVIATAGYDPVADLPNTPDSVFCAHGAGYPVAWDLVPQTAHCPYRLAPKL
ncbi:elongation factor G [Lacticaseibacillus kribbianus]|uniref:elongation factor G n=1 Tax=Lacticaseibacillus kribbianus TaxID=2926292 RepID=UPI001CD39DF9|nr:TetM/TetW/TetO/TetS family tetracycline resistance ribosomal protection protein [Lacticaseibacillus kribbianus]